MKPPKHKRFKMMPLMDPEQPLRVRIVGPTDTFLTVDAYSITVMLKDGLMQINKRYSSVIERIKQGEVKVKISNSPSSEILRYHVSSGWLISSNNLCELLVKECQKIEKQNG
ncbi:hypothetical protein [Mycoplasma parvum]|uniref:Uncharacterized protein n=1 Tax=Mycoplasma parvum str. Indiana TaxID=1403316 RepID=U5NCH9_9MOLU|nr:hypothetical protein [Mycoplasma parvum]AGX89030.1 hypothetical protein PRV_01345 [Mycoplasma parvum str. Indiana]